MAKRLFLEILVFPMKERVKEICKSGQGEKTCRYLKTGSIGWRCAKFSSSEKGIDQRVASGAIHAKGDNCGGVIDLIMENQAVLKGRKVEYKESISAAERKGTLKKLCVRDGALRIIADWEEPGVNPDREIPIDALGIALAKDGISFEIVRLGAFGGRTKVFF